MVNKNYLINLPSRSNYYVKTGNVRKFIEQLKCCDMNTEDHDLIYFRQNLNEIIISKLKYNSNTFDLNAYCSLRNNIVDLNEEFIKNYADVLLEILSQNEEKKVDYIDTIDNYYNFSSRYERKAYKENDIEKYKSVKRKIEPSDIIVYLNEIEKTANSMVAKNVLVYIDCSKKLEDLNYILENLDDFVLDTIIEKYNEKFKNLEESNIKIFSSFCEFTRNTIKEKIYMILKERFNHYFLDEKEVIIKYIGSWAADRKIKKINSR